MKNLSKVFLAVLLIFMLNGCALGYLVDVDGDDTTISGDGAYYIEFEPTISNDNVETIFFDIPSDVTALPLPTAQGYNFEGWYIDSSTQTEFTVQDITLDNFSLFARWSPKQFTIYYEENGGNPVSDYTGDYDTTFPNNAPTRQGYLFGGWYLDSGLTIPLESHLIPANDLTIYAKWHQTSASLKVEYYFQDVTASSYVLGDTKTYSASVESNYQADTLSFSGFTFYDNHPLNVLSGVVAGDGSLTLKLHYDRNVVEIEIISTNHMDFIDSTTLQGLYEAPIPQIEEPERTGFTFGGFYFDPDYNQPFDLTEFPWGYLMIFVKWIPLQSTITFDTMGGDALPPLTADNESLIQLPTPNKTGHTFIGWYVDSNYTTEYTKSMMEVGDRIIYAKWIIEMYTITFDTLGGNEITGWAGYYDTELPSFSIPTRTGYTFIGWYTDIDLTTEFTLTKFPGYDITIYAKWEIDP